MTESRRSKNVALLVAGGSLVVAALWVVGPFVFADRDDTESLDTRAVREAAEAACTEMRAAVDGAGGDEEAANRAAEAMVARLRALGPETLGDDRPAEAWLADWEALIAARRAGEPVPLEDGVPIHRRMDELVKDMRVCQVPPELRPSR